MNEYEERSVAAAVADKVFNVPIPLTCTVPLAAITTGGRRRRRRRLTMQALGVFAAVGATSFAVSLWPVTVSTFFDNRDANGSVTQVASNAQSPMTAEPNPSITQLTAFRLPNGAGVVLDVVPTAEHPHITLEVTTGGPVELTPDGCLGFVADGQTWLFVWPSGTTPLADGQGVAVPGLGEFRLGDTVQAGARAFAGDGPDFDVSTTVPEVCGHFDGLVVLSG